MTTLVIDQSELDAVAARMGTAGRIVAEETRTALTRSALRVQGTAREEVKVDTGLLRNSIAYEVRRTSAVVGTSVDYARPVHDGRRPGAAMPPAGSLVGWLKRHGIPEEAEYAVRRAIGRRGIPANPFLRIALDRNRKAITAEFQNAAKRIARRVMTGRV